MCVSMGHTDERALNAWDVWMCEGPLGVFEVPGVEGRFHFDVAMELLKAGKYGGWGYVFVETRCNRVYLCRWVRRSRIGLQCVDATNVVHGRGIMSRGA